MERFCFFICAQCNVIITKHVLGMSAPAPLQLRNCDRGASTALHSRRCHQRQCVMSNATAEFSVLTGDKLWILLYSFFSRIIAGRYFYRPPVSTYTYFI